ncbi:unnamed protein product [Lymnaea stagnalis]|uniref:Sec1 family domain-containing protein 2 n=1 Tax=Lymnaea stagnalis TaxID=6523 RepID=A0AAV2HSG8_LYMST
MHKSVWMITEEWWKELKLKVNHAVVYMDNQMAEFLHWSGGIGILLSAGVVDIREFSSFESASESIKKSVFIISSPLTGVTEDIIRDIVTQSQFQYVIILTTASPLLHPGNEDSSGDDAVFEAFEEKVLEWMRNMNYTVEISHMPMFGAEVCPGLFIAPAFSTLFPILTSDVKQIAYQFKSSHNTKDPKPIEGLKDLELSHLPDNLQLQIKLLASGLHALLQGLDVKEDIYSIGHTSRLVAAELDSYPPARMRRKAVQNRASLVLIDRTLDTASAVTHQMDSLMDKIINTLPPLPGHSSDRLVDMQALCHVIRSDSLTSVILPGSLASTNFTCEPSHLLPLIHKKQKEAIMEVNRRLVETASAEKLPLNLTGRPGRITADQIEASVSLFKGKYPLVKKHLDLLQVAMATSQALKHPAGQDSCVITEKNVVQTMAENDESAPSGISVLSKLILQEMQKPTDKRDLTLDDVLGLLAYVYDISDGECGDEDEEMAIRELLVEWIIKDSDVLPPLFKKIVGDKVNESILTDQIENLWTRLEDIGCARDSMQQFKSVLNPGDAVTPADVRPLLRQLVEKIVDPAKPELPDVECKSGGLKDLLKSGFGFFKSSGKPRPGDAPLLMLFVIGGVTAGEVKQIRDVVDKAKPQFEVIIGATRLSSISSTLESIFVSDNINKYDL